MKTIAALVTLFVAGVASGAELAIQVINSKGGAVADAAVSLIPLDTPAPAVAADARAEVAQQDQEFLPYVTVVQTGTQVVFPNRDSVQHHVYSLSKPKKFELPLYNPGAKASEVFEVPGLVTLGCNIHDWMISHVVVVPTPWFGLSTPEGEVRLAAPAGRYRLELWHPRLAVPLTREVTLADSAPAQEKFTLTLKADRRVRRSSPGKAGGY